MKAAFEHVETPPVSSFLCYRRISQVYEFNWHYHPEYELTYVYRGHGTRIVGDDVSEYQEHDLVFLGPNLPHTWFSAGAVSTGPASNQAVVIQFPDACLTDGLLDLHEMKHVARLLERSARGLHFRGGALRKAGPRILELTSLSGLERFVRLLLILEILARSEDVRPLAAPGFAPALNRRNEMRMDAVFRRIHESYRHELRLADVAAVANLAEASFSRFFKKMTGKTFTDYVNDVRISKACEWLIESDETIAEVAFSSGFNNLSHFNRTFKRRKACTPSEYRQQFRREQSKS